MKDMQARLDRKNKEVLAEEEKTKTQESEARQEHINKLQDDRDNLAVRSLLPACFVFLATCSFLRRWLLCVQAELERLKAELATAPQRAEGTATASSGPSRSDNKPAKAEKSRAQFDAKPAKERRKKKEID